MKLKRSSGILLHITSLPTEFGIGDLGSSAYQFVDFLKDSGHTYWQMLPLNPTDAAFGHSPYSSYSAFGGNPLLISPELLAEEGYIQEKEIKNYKIPISSKVDFTQVEKAKLQLLELAYIQFRKNNRQYKIAFEKFLSENKSWLASHSLFKAIRDKAGSGKWSDWEKEIRDRKPAAIKKAEKELKREIDKENFIQYLFFSQWQTLREYAHQKDVQLFGDIPFYVNFQSADCWANPGYFKLNNNKNPIRISGVPPDYFSEDGQLWGTPVYKWKNLKENKFEWWLARLRQNLNLFDLVRLDHFRAFAAFWEVPSHHTNAKNGRWSRSPGNAIFKEIKEEFPDMPFIAEDLGSLDEPVYKLIEKFSFPGMKVLQFAFGGETGENPYIPHNHGKNYVVYTGTHDNNTTIGWFKKLSAKEKRKVKEYCGTSITPKNVHEVLHRFALMSVADLAIVPMQDILGLGEEGMMNSPGTAENNWTWRMTREQFSFPDPKKLLEMNKLYGRVQSH